jgi:hypothetical protein
MSLWMKHHEGIHNDGMISISHRDCDKLVMEREVENVGVEAGMSSVVRRERVCDPADLRGLIRVPNM